MQLKPTLKLASTLAEPGLSGRSSPGSREKGWEKQRGGNATQFGVNQEGRWASDLPAFAGDMDVIPGLGRSPGGGNDYSLQYSCLEHPIDRGASWATVHGVAKSETRLSD